VPSFWKIAIRPGKPVIFGLVGKMPVLGMSGNPVSALVSALMFLRPAIAAMLGQVIGAGSRRDQIERVADRIDCAKLSELIRRQGQCANIDLLCLHAADVDLRDVGDMVVAKRVHPAAANHGGAGRRAVTDVEEIVARAADQSVNARAAEQWSENGNYSIKHFFPMEQSPQTTKYCC